MQWSSLVAQAASRLVGRGVDGGVSGDPGVGGCFSVAGEAAVPVGEQASVVLGDAWMQLLLSCRPGSSARSSVAVYQWQAREPGILALGVVQAQTGLPLVTSGEAVLQPPLRRSWED